MYELIFDRDKFYLYPWYFADQALTSDIEKIFGRKINKVILEFKNSRVFYYSSAEEFNSIGEYLLNRIKNDHKFYKSVQKNILETGKNLMNFCQTIEKINLKEITDKKLITLYSTYADKIKKMRAWGWVPPLVDGTVTYFLSDYVQSEFKRFMGETRDAEKTANYFSILSSSEKMSEVQQEEIARLELIKELEKENKNLIKVLKGKSAKLFLNKIKGEYPDLYKKIKKHAKQFKWLPYAYIGPGLSEEGTIDLMKNCLSKKESASKQIKKINDHYKKLPGEKRKIIKEINLSNNLKYIFKVYCFFMYLKDMRKGIYQKSYVAMDPIIEEVSDRIGLTIQEVKYLTLEETKEALLNNKNFKNIAKERTKYCMALTERGKTVFLKKEEIKKINKDISREEFKEDIAEIKGMVAFAGKVRGIAKIIEIAEDMPKLKEGDILISPATNPDLVPAMKKAKAFVTDTGGIACHAAIVSRELKVPCIIGTKIATKVIKDGDLVEVDAINGIVRIIKK